MTSASSMAVTAAAHRAPAQPASVRWALTRVEGRRLVTHPLFLFGILTSVTAIVLADGDAFERSSMLSGDCFVMLGGALWTFIVAFLATGREHRDGAHDFYAAAPLTSRARSEAALLSIAFAGAAGAALIAIAILVLAGPDGVVAIDAIHHPGQPVPEPSYALQPLEVAQGPMFLMLAGVLGVLAGSWTRHVFAGVFAALMLFLPPVALLTRHVYDRGGWFGAVQVSGPFGSDIAAWHLTAMVGLIALAAAAAPVRHDRGVRVVILALVGSAATAAAIAFGPHLVG